MNSLTFDPYTFAIIAMPNAKPANPAKVTTSLAPLACLAAGEPKTAKSTMPINPAYWLECYQKTYGKIREYETDDEARIQAKREIFYAYILRTYPDICREFESLINSYME